MTPILFQSFISLKDFLDCLTLAYRLIQVQFIIKFKLDSNI
jgi:hypothetical protein